MKRRTFLSGTAGGLSVLALAACGTPEPRPTPSVSPSPVPTTVPKPLAMRRTSWSEDPFARGSFTFPAVGATPEQRAVLREPVLSRVLFAGEATATDEPGTVQGARESGRRAADQVRDLAAAGERIAIVGAGMAGLTAARALHDDGFSVVVIEARDRIGGRIHTFTHGDWPSPIELGPSFISNPDQNSLDEQLTRLGVTTVPFPPTPQARTREGAVVEVSPIGAEAVAAALAWAATRPRDVSLERALVDSGEAKQSTTKNADGVSDADWLEYEISTRLKIDSGATPSLESAWYTSVAAPPEERLVVGGYAKILTDDAAGLDVLSSSVVTRVATTDDGVSLRLGAGESLAADRVILTVPLGVLKTDAVEFSPPLPFAHRGAIAALGVGVLDKVWLRFKEPFWDTDAPLWTVVGEDADFPVWVNMLPLTGEPVLMGYFAAENAARLAAVDDDEFLAAALRGLEPFVAVPAPAP